MSACLSDPPYCPALMAVTQEQSVRDYLQRAQQAEVWAAAVDDAFLKQQWLTIATSYRALARAPAAPSRALDMLSRL